MKKFLLLSIPVILITIVVSLLVFSRSGVDLFSKLPFTNELYKDSALSITTVNGIATVLIDDVGVGQTPLELTDLKPGPHKIQLTKDSDSTGFYESEIYFIDLMPNTESIIDIEIGPVGIGAGYVLYYTESPTIEGSGLISISGFPTGADVSIDGESIGKLPVYSKEYKSGEYQVKVLLDGYESEEFPAIVREGFNLNITVELMPIPTSIEPPETTELEESLTEEEDETAPNEDGTEGTENSDTDNIDEPETENE